MPAEITPGPWTYGVRQDGSIWLSIGDPKTGPHHQGDLVGTVPDARLIVASPKMLDALREAALALAHASAGRASPYEAAYRSVSDAIQGATEGEQTPVYARTLPWVVGDEWYRGEPPHVGWWNASYDRDPHVWRWWNGQCWSKSALASFSARAAAEMAGSKAFNGQAISWRNFYPANARVPRVDPNFGPNLNGAS